MGDDWSNKRVLVTGAGRGIGRAVALRFGELGAQVAVAARSVGEIEAVAAEIGSRGMAVPCDISSEESVASCVASVNEAFGGIDILVNTAGISPSAPIHKMAVADWDKVMGVNLRGPFLLTRQVLPLMLKGGWGRVIHLASIAGKAGMAYVAGYCASKHGLMGMVRASALEVAERGITINAVCPGYVESPMTDDNVARIAEKTGHPQEAVRAKMEGFSPQNRLFEPDEIADTVVYLASHSARGINGQGINVCGGSVPS